MNLPLDELINIRDDLERITAKLIRPYMGRDEVSYEEAELLFEDFEKKATKKIEEIFERMQAVSVMTIEKGSEKFMTFIIITWNS